MIAKNDPHLHSSLEGLQNQIDVVEDMASALEAVLASLQKDEAPWDLPARVTRKVEEAVTAYRSA